MSKNQNPSSVVCCVMRCRVYRQPYPMFHMQSQQLNNNFLTSLYEFERSGRMEYKWSATWQESRSFRPNSSSIYNIYKSLYILLPITFAFTNPSEMNVVLSRLASVGFFMVKRGLFYIVTKSIAGILYVIIR